MIDPCPCIAQTFLQIHPWKDCPDCLGTGRPVPAGGAADFVAAFEAVVFPRGGPLERGNVNALDYMRIRKEGRDHLEVEVHRAMLAKGRMGAWRGPSGESVEVYTDRLVRAGTMDCLRAGQAYTVPFPG